MDDRGSISREDLFSCVLRRDLPDVHRYSCSVGTGYKNQGMSSATCSAWLGSTVVRLLLGVYISLEEWGCLDQRERKWNYIREICLMKSRIISKPYNYLCFLVCVMYLWDTDFRRQYIPFVNYGIILSYLPYKFRCVSSPCSGPYIRHALV